MVANGWVMVVGGDCGLAKLRRKKCDFIDDLGSEMRGRDGFVFWFWVFSFFFFIFYFFLMFLFCDFGGWG